MSESQGNPPPQGGQGNGAPGASSGGEATFGFKTEEEFSERVNKAITGRFKDFEKKVDAKFGEVQTGITSAFTSKFDEFAKTLEGLKPKPEEQKGKGKDAVEAPTFKLEDQPEWKAHQAELKTLKAKADAAEQSAAAEREKNRSTSLRSTLGEQLTKVANVAADRHRAAIALLKSEGRVDYADGGKGDDIVWRNPDGEEVSLEQGLKEWAKSPDAKIFQPPMNPKGSGGGPGGRASGSGGSGKGVDDLIVAELFRDPLG